MRSPFRRNAVIAVSVADVADTGGDGHRRGCRKSPCGRCCRFSTLPAPILAGMVSHAPPDTPLAADVDNESAVRVSGSALWDGPLAPLNLAAYAIFALIAVNQLGAPATLTQRLVLATTLGLFIGAFVVGEWLCAGGQKRRLRTTLLVLQVAAAMANLALEFDGLNPILLVLVAAQLPGFMALPAALALLVALDAVMYVLLREVHTQYRALFNVAVYSTFQFFAMLTTWFAFRAERANALLAAANAELLATRSLLEEGARDGERLRLSRELHDVAGHTLTALQLHLELARRLPDADQRAARLDAAQQLADSLLREIRGVVSQLRRHDGIDLPTALRALCQGFPGVVVQLDVDAALRVTDVERAEALLRAVQEALTNAVRHGRARQVKVRLWRDGDTVRLEVVDNGQGTAAIQPGHGLTGMRERLMAHAGDLHWNSAPGRGLRLQGHLQDLMDEAA